MILYNFTISVLEFPSFLTSRGEVIVLNFESFALFCVPHIYTIGEGEERLRKIYKDQIKKRKKFLTFFLTFGTS